MNKLSLIYAFNITASQLLDTKTVAISDVLPLEAIRPATRSPH